MKTLNDLDFDGKKVLIRVDFNVPLNDRREITDDTRIRGALPTIKKILESGGSPILMSHLGRPKGTYDEKYSLKPVAGHLARLLNSEVQFAGDCVGEATRKIADDLKPGQTLLLENLRFHEEETKGDEAFSEQLSELADLYVNDAFGTAHRAHASTTIVARFFPGKSAFGYLIEKELSNMDKILQQPQKPFTAIMGGAKVSDKIQVIENLLDKIDNLVIGGGMTYTFVKAKGGQIGDSICEEDKLDMARDILEKAGAKNVRVYLPTDNVVASAFENDANTKITASDTVPDGWMGLDIGPETIDAYNNVIGQSKTILWNGPMGVFEMSSFQKGTKSIAESIARASSKGAFSLIGGGDSVAAINKYDLKDQVGYVSTGGGAMLEYMEGKELPGIKAIRG
jgi:phosphoglycerate kinase